MTTTATPPPAATAPMPALFLGHGSPMNVITDNRWRARWSVLGRELPRPAAILCVSAHWESAGVRVASSAKPRTIHDFYGFPPELYAVTYPAPGSPALAARVQALLAAEGATADPDYGLDHGAWGVMHSMYPEADVPVAQLSLDTRRPASWHYRLARLLAPLRDEGVLVLGSGNVVHNLRRYQWNDPSPLPWAEAFDAEVRARITAGDHAPLVEFATLGEAARLSVPTPEHYLPLLYVLALQRPGEAAQFFNTDVESSLSMTSVRIG